MLALTYTILLDILPFPQIAHVSAECRLTELEEHTLLTRAPSPPSTRALLPSTIVLHNRLQLLEALFKVREDMCF